jgi:FkbM family methyltransferase
LFDLARRINRARGKKTPVYEFLDRFSRAHHRRVNFIQIGANDGLRNDPIREFIVRDHWAGVLVEPLPQVFELLQKNYRRVHSSRLIFANTVISTSNSDQVSFWVFDEPFLASRSFEGQMGYLRKSSLDVEHLRQFFTSPGRFEDQVKEIRVPCLTLRRLVEQYWDGGPIDLLVIDAEGHDASILLSLDFDVVDPAAILFELLHLGGEKEKVFDYLTGHGYDILEAGDDAIASRSQMAIGGATASR